MARPRPARRGPWIVLLMMTVLSLAGPFGIWWVIRGGRSPDWPPDRAVEWWTFGGVVGAVAALMVGCVGMFAANLNELNRARRSDNDLDLSDPERGDDPNDLTL